MNPVHPKKLLLSKWTAVQPVGKARHFLVAEVVLPDDPQAPVQWVEIEAVISRRRQRIAWRDLRDSARWQRGWL